MIAACQYISTRLNVSEVLAVRNVSVFGDAIHSHLFVLFSLVAFLSFLPGTFPEFPGCFYCDTSAITYKVAVYFHYACSFVAGCMAMLFFAKIILARRVVIDELSSPTTAAPAGLMCMTMVCVFAGRGIVGQALVTLAASMHLMLAMWYIYMALAYRILPDPSWFPK